MTSYVVLAQDVSDGVWRDVGQQEARTAEAAVRLWIEGTTGREAHAFVAIPARQWKPMRVQVEQKTQVRVEMWGSQ